MDQRRSASTSGRPDARRGVSELLFAGPDGVVGLLGCCTLVVHTVAPTEAILSAMARAYSKAADRYEKIAHFCLLEPDSTFLPMGDARSAIGVLMERFKARMAVAALVYEETGFKATAVRSIVTGLCMAARTTHPTRVFTELAEACQWMTGKLPAGEPLAPEQLLSAVRELRGHHEQHPSGAQRPSKV